MANPTENEVGYSIRLPGGVGDIATLPSVLNSFFQRTDTTFAIVFDIEFTDDNYNVFFGGAISASSVKLMRNKTVGKIDLELIDESADHRDYTWTCELIRNTWYNFIVNGTANAADGIQLYVAGTQKTASAQTNAAGYDAAVSPVLKFGDIDATNLGGCNVSKIYFYNRNLTAQEITDINKIKKYPSDFVSAWDLKRPHIGLE